MLHHFLAILACSLFYHASILGQGVDRYTGTWKTENQSSPFERIVISPERSSSKVMDVNLWYACPQGLCSLKNLKALIIGKADNNFLVLEASLPGYSYSIPMMMFPTLHSDYLNVRVKQGGDYTQLLTFAHVANPNPSPSNQSVATRQRNSSAGTINDYFEEQGDNLFGQISPEDGSVPPTNSVNSYSNNQVAEYQTSAAQAAYYPSQEPLFSPEFESSAGSIVLSHCHTCSDYQLKVYSNSHTYYIDPEQTPSRRWECELPALNPGVYRLKVIWRDSFSKYGSPPYREDRIKIEPGNNDPVRKVMSRR